MSITPELLAEIEARAQYAAHVDGIDPRLITALVAHVREVEKERDDWEEKLNEVARAIIPAWDGIDVSEALVGIVNSYYAQSQQFGELEAERDALTAQLETDRRLAASELSHVMAGWKSSMERAKSERDELAAKLEEAEATFVRLTDLVLKGMKVLPSTWSNDHLYDARELALAARLTAEPAKGGEG